MFIASPALQLLAPLTSLIFRRIARGRGCAAGSGAPGRLFAARERAQEKRAQARAGAMRPGAWRLARRGPGAREPFARSWVWAVVLWLGGAFRSGCCLTGNIRCGTLAAHERAAMRCGAAPTGAPIDTADGLGLVAVYLSPDL